MLAGVLARSSEYGVPAAVLVHGLFQSVLPIRDAMLEIGNQLRAQAGLSSLDTAAMTWENKDLVLVTTLRELDGAAADPAPERVLRGAGVRLAAGAARLAAALARQRPAATG